jgi:hypothetical protein
VYGVFRASHIEDHIMYEHRYYDFFSSDIDAFYSFLLPGCFAPGLGKLSDFFWW